MHMPLVCIWSKKTYTFQSNNYPYLPGNTDRSCQLRGAVHPCVPVGPQPYTQVKSTWDIFVLTKKKSFRAKPKDALNARTMNVKGRI